MNKKSCSTCLFGELCTSEIDCEHYSPINDDMGDAELGQFIETGYLKYISDWWNYIEGVDE